MAEEDRAWGSVGFGGTRAPVGSRVQGRDGRGLGKKVCGWGGQDS